jgi:hypothetical protein
LNGREFLPQKSRNATEETPNWAPAWDFFGGSRDLFHAAMGMVEHQSLPSLFEYGSRERNEPLSLGPGLVEVQPGFIEG